MKLAEIAHSRAGDKGNISTLSLIPFDENDYPLLVKTVTEARVQDHFSGLIQGKITRYEMPNISALLFVCEGALETGVTTAITADPHGKALSYALLEMDI